MADTESKPAPSSAGRAHHLYHKEKPPPRSRLRSDATPRWKDEEPEFERDNRTNPAVALMVTHLRRLAFTGLAMVILLFLVVKGLGLFWSMKDRKQRTSFAPPAAAETASEPIPALASTDTVATATMRPLPAPGTGLNTEAIRRAVFLAKHAETFERNGDYEKAVERYREALDIWPHLNTVWAQLGRLYLRTRDFPRAQIALEKAVESNPGSAEMLNDLGVSYLYQGKTDKARDLFEAAMEIDPQFAPSLFNMALCYLNLNERGNARDALARYLRMKPEDPRALREIAFMDALDTRYDEAMASLEKALARMPDWPLLYFDAAAVAALMGRPDQAVRFLEKAEPLTDPATVFQLYKEPAFREIRLTELGKMFEQELAQRARERTEQSAPRADNNAPTEPMTSAAATPAAQNP